MGKKEKWHKRSHTSKKNKLDTTKSRSRHKSRPRPKARPDSYDSFSTSDTSSSDYKHKQTLHRKWHGTKHSRSDCSPDRGHITKNKRRKRFETTTTDSESEVHLDTEVDTAVDSDNGPTPNLCYLDVEIEKKQQKTSSSNIVNLKLPDSTGKKKIKKRNNKDDPRRTQNTF